MYEYKVLIVKAKACQQALNEYAKDGWRLTTMTSTNADGREVIATLERIVEDKKIED